MATLRNESTRAWVLPRRESGKGERMRAVRLEVGATIDVPDWYLASLRTIKGLAGAFDKPRGIATSAGPAEQSPAPSSIASELDGLEREALRELARELGLAERVDLRLGAEALRAAIREAIEAGDDDAGDR